jgi:predicted site-specific integrase-resolvase
MNVEDQATQQSKYINPSMACAMLGISGSTLRRYDDNGWIHTIRTAGGQRRYHVGEIISFNKNNFFKKTQIPTRQINHLETKGAIYARVSSKKQEDDLQRQIDALQKDFPSFKVYKDTCSGLNYKRKGLTRLLEHVQGGAIKTVVVAHKDRLARFATEIIEWIIHQAGGRLIIQDSGNRSPEQELTEDLMAIVHVFSCRLNGKRAHKNRKKRACDNQSKTSRVKINKLTKSNDASMVQGCSKNVQCHTSLHPGQRLPPEKLVDVQDLQLEQVENNASEKVCQNRESCFTQVNVFDAENAKSATPASCLSIGGAIESVPNQAEEARVVSKKVPTCNHIQERIEI